VERGSTGSPPDSHITEVCWEGSTGALQFYSHPESTNLLVSGSSQSIPSQANTRQESDADPLPFDSAPRTVGYPSASTILGSGIAGITWSDFEDPDGDLDELAERQLFWQAEDGRIMTSKWQPGDAFEPAAQPISQPILDNNSLTSPVYRTNLAAVRLPGRKASVFYQKGYDRLCEIRFDGKQWLDLGPIW
jgi:hypothetical protein